MPKVHYENGYFAHIYFDHTKEDIYGTIIEVTRRFGNASNLLKIKIDHALTTAPKRIHLSTDSCDYIHADAGFLVSAKPIRNSPYKTYGVMSFKNSDSTWLQAKKKGYLHGSISSLIYHAYTQLMLKRIDLRHQKGMLGVDLERAIPLFSKAFKCERLLGVYVTIKKKQLERWMQQNVNRIQYTAAEVHRFTLLSEKEDEEQYFRDLEDDERYYYDSEEIQ